MDRALLVGINKYPGSPLNGCINDIDDIAQFIQSQYAFPDTGIRQLKDEAATAEAIRDSLAWLMEDATAGDRLLFHYSGHGTTMPKGRVVEDAICPVDFDWSAEHALMTSDFASIFGAIPDGVEFNWLSDSCHSGNLTRFLLPPRTTIRFLPPPPAVEAQIHTILGSAPRLLRLKAAAPLYGGFISGCATDETSADAFINDRYNGAFTYCLIETLRAEPGASLINLTADVIKDLRRRSFSQTPQVRGTDKITSQPLLSKPARVSLRSFGGLAPVEPSRAPESGVSLKGGKLTLAFGDVSVVDDQDLARLLETLAPQMASVLMESRETGAPREWSVSATVSTTQGGTTASTTGTYTSRDWNVSVSGSTNVGGATVTGTASTGSQGTSGTVTIGASF